MYQQEAPFAIQVELVEGCNLFCDFCGLHGIREAPNRNMKFMEQGIADTIAQQIHDAKWTSRIEFAMHGEPSMHPDLLTIAGIFRKRLPNNQLMITSNGGGFINRPSPGSYITSLMMNAVDILALDQYENIKFVPKLRVLLAEMGADFKYPIYDYPDEPKGNPHRRTKQKFVTIIQDISKAAKGTHSLVNNHTGCGSPKNNSMQGKRCAKPFRELSVRWDGSVALCCNDWRGVYKCGNVGHDFIDQIWRGPSFEAARRKLIVGERTFAPCLGCDARSYRTGLLPDKLGKEKMEPPNSWCDTVIGQALEGQPYTEPVHRPWELPMVTP